MFRSADDSKIKRAKTPRGLRVLMGGGLTTVLVLGAVVCDVPSVGAAPKPPPNPSNGQLSAAQQAKNNMANQVGKLSGLLAQATTQLAQLTADAGLKEQKYALAMSQLADAKQAAIQAQAAIVAAQKQLDAAHRSLQNFVRNSYIAPSATGGPGGLLTATDPNALLQRGDYLRYVSDRHLDVMSTMDKATVAKSNADAKAKAAVQLQTKLSIQAQAAFQAAKDARDRQQQLQAQLQTQQASYQRQLNAAQAQLATLNGQRAKYNAYVKEQQRLAAIAAAKAEAARERAAAAAAAAAAANQSNGGGGGGGGGGGFTVYNPPSSLGGWTAAKGQAAVNRAMTTVGTPYAWAGGNANGPTFGVNSPGTDGWNDSTVFGFDCSGLVMFAWASQGLYLAHYAATQFSQAGSYHPAPGNFMPGDLLFWGLPGQGDIHHVAIYIGGGNVIQAPNSGSVVQVTPWDQVSGDYFGATRPLT
ncbi:NlpC/P60 family protein [Jatrophihabitans sp. DSM 45814]